MGLGAGRAGVLRLVRVMLPDGARCHARVIEVDEGEPTHVQPLRGELFTGLGHPGAPIALTDVRLLAPLDPGKLVGIGSNYRKHALEMGKPVPTVPKIFLMPASAVVGPDEAVRLPPGTTRVDHEAELGVVIGRRATMVDPEDALAHVFGYTVVNDVTARDFQKQDGTFSRAKGFDSFCPTGPCISVGLDPSDLRVQAWVQRPMGKAPEHRQDGRTSDMVFDVPTLVSFVSHVMTLEPGDVISTGTPSGVGPLRPGDVVTVAVEGIGALANPVVARSDRAGGA